MQIRVKKETTMLIMDFLYVLFMYRVSSQKTIFVLKKTMLIKDFLYVLFMYTDEQPENNLNYLGQTIFFSQKASICVLC